MKLLTHNLLTSKCIKGVVTGFPLKILAQSVKILDVDFNSNFIVSVLPKIDWSVLRGAAESIGHDDNLPNEVPSNPESNEEFLKKVHHVLLEIEVVDGELICPETGRKFPINNGIPNMLLNEDEV